MSTKLKKWKERKGPPHFIFFTDRKRGDEEGFEDAIGSFDWELGEALSNDLNEMDGYQREALKGLLGNIVRTHLKILMKTRSQKSPRELQNALNRILKTNLRLMSHLTQ
jgi:DNA-binding MurR/RpiR family transcriptional regulator